METNERLHPLEYAFQEKKQLNSLVKEIEFTRRYNPDFEFPPGLLREYEQLISLYESQDVNMFQ